MTQRRFIPRILGAALAAGAISSFLAPTAGFAQPPRLPDQCRFHGVKPTLKASTANTYGDFHYASVDAMNVWNRSVIATKIYAAESGANIQLYEYSSSDTWWASTDVSGCSGGYWSTGRVITLNDLTMDSLSTREKRIVIQHELGHALGLAHPSGTLWCGNPSMMFQGESKFSCATDPIWNDDARAINAIYATA